MHAQLDTLLERCTTTESFKQLKQLLEQRRSPLYVAGLSGSAATFVSAALHKNLGRVQLWVCTDKDRASYVYSDLITWLSKQDVHFFPDSFKHPNRFDVPYAYHHLLRTRTLHHLAQSTKPIVVVSYPQAIAERVPQLEKLSHYALRLQQGQTYPVDELVDNLLDWGFEATDFVYEPGQFALRGGLLDVFAFGNEWPLRIEFVDEEIAQLRLFKPEDQCSIATLDWVYLLPDYRKVCAEPTGQFLQLLPPQSTVWIEDYEAILNSLQECWTYRYELQSTADFEESPQIPPVDLTPPEEALVLPDDVHTLYLKRPTGLQAETVRFHTAPQPHFNKNVDLLIDNLQGLLREGYALYLFSEDTRQIARLESIFEDRQCSIPFQPIRESLAEGWIDRHLRCAFYTDHQIFERYHRHKLRRGFSKDTALTLQALRALNPGDYVVHYDHGIGRFSGLEKIKINGKVMEAVRIQYAGSDVLYVSIHSLHKLSKYSTEDGKVPKLHRLGSPAWKNLKRRTKKKIKDIAADLIRLYAKRKASQGHAFSADNALQYELEASFFYQDTPDQARATADVKRDMESPHPMDRLICGDVGFGKTEVAIRAAFKAVLDDKQVAVLVPTTILALQHYQTFSQRMKDFGVAIEYLTRFKSAKQKRAILEKLADGKIDIIIGTHALLSKDVRFHDLGLLIIDEEQKFGVAAKEKIRQLKVNVDTLTMTATPIPRTLKFSLLGARDLSVINTPPPNRQPIHTERRAFSPEFIREAIYYEIHRGGQVFFVHNRIQTLPAIVQLLQRLCPDLHIASAHGQMPAQEIEHTMRLFIEGQIDVLVSTNIIETGLDIPNANTIFINDAHLYGLSDLHQLRGRVGRSNRKAFCYLLTPPHTPLTENAIKRLRTVEEFSELGSGIHIALRDLHIRGAGNLLGSEQSGFINNLGFETYQRILDEAIRELKEVEFKELFKEQLQRPSYQYIYEVSMELGEEMYIPDDYVQSQRERMNLYTRLNSIRTEAGLQRFAEELKDRFGPLPDPVIRLLDTIRIKWICQKLAFECIILKDNTLKIHLPENPSNPYYDSPLFQRLLQYIHSQPQQCQLKQSTRRLSLLIKDIRDIRALKAQLSAMQSFLIHEEPQSATL